MGNQANLALVFLTNEAGEDEGLGHAGIETYRDRPYASVARECGQNSRDSHNEATGLPVELHFDLLRIPRSSYPTYSAQHDAVGQCLKKAKTKKDDKEIEFFVRAKEVLEQNEIAILRIEDRNTKGLIGPAVPGTPFHSLVKSAGVSNKESDTSGGSFGIGKNAAFAASELQTVFYSTAYPDSNSGNPVFLAQGKTILISHTDIDGKERRATGYWGKPGFMPVDEKTAVPQWLRRDAQGTSVFVAGFRESADWQYRIAASLLQNFFCGIHRGEIRFLLANGEIDINAATLGPLFEDKLVNLAAEEVDGGEEFRVARNLYECMKSPDSSHEDLDIEGMGPVRLSMLMRDGLPKRVRIVRNGMSITDELSSFGDKLASFPMYREFVALVEPTSHDGNKLIKRLENPRHDALSAERLADPKKRAEATKAMRKLAKAIRKAIKDKALTKLEERVDLSELSEYFDVPEAANTPPSSTDEENPQILRYKPAPPRRRTVQEPPATGRGGQGGGGYGSGGGGNGSGRGRRQGAGTNGTGPRSIGSQVPLTNLRNIVVASGPYTRRVFFTPSDTCKALLELRAAGMDQPEVIQVTKADLGSVEKGKLVLDIQSGARTTIAVAFSSPYGGPIEMIATRLGA